MLSAKPPELEILSSGDDGTGIDYDPRTRRRRLDDVNRGKYYFQRLDKLADTYWKNNDPVSKPHTKARLAPIRPITDSFYSQQYAKKRMHYLAQMQDKKLEDICKKRVQSETFLLSKEYRNQKKLAKNEEGQYNQWGSGYDPLEEKLKPKKEDFQSRYEPFRFRDSVKHVLKPVPKKPVVMSRVAKQTYSRQLKKQRNYRSESGTVNIIQPVEHWPEHEERMISYFDPDEVEKESTFVILDRIDKILHPVKYNLLKERDSSEENEPPSITNKESDFSEHLSLEEELEDKDHLKRESIHKSLSKKDKHLNVKQASSRRHHNVNIRRSHNAASLASIVEKLEMSKLDAFKKCQLWVVKCKEANWYFQR